jgi:hypothetical protein
MSNTVLRSSSHTTEEGIMGNITPDKLAAVYLKIRNKIRDLEAEITQHKEQMEIVSNKMLEFCAEGNINSINTPEGTISRRISSRYWTSDWESMYKFIHDNDAAFLLEKRLSNGALKEFLTENPDLCPPGLQSNNEYVISVRKPTNN